MRYWSTRLTSTLSPVAARARLESALQAAGFTGSVDDERFELRRITSHVPSSPPVLRGSILPAATGCEVRAALHVQPSWIAVGVLWFGGTAAVLVQMIHDGVPRTALGNLLIPIALGVTGLSWFGGALYYELQQARLLLRSIASA